MAYPSNKRALEELNIILDNPLSVEIDYLYEEQLNMERVIYWQNEIIALSKFVTVSYKKERNS